LACKKISWRKQIFLQTFEKLKHPHNLFPLPKQNSFASWKLEAVEFIKPRLRLWLFLFSILLITWILYWRRPDAFVNPQLWAEDGEVFFTDTYFSGIRNLFLSYRGIYHVLGRLVALPGRWLPLAYIPHYYYFMTWLMLVALTGFIFSKRVPFSLLTKSLLSLAIVANAADHEVFFNIANWTTISALWWFLLAIAIPPATRSGKILDVVILVLNGLNSAFTVVLWPLFLIRWLITRQRYHAFLAAVALLLGIAQLWNMGGRIPAGTFWPQFDPKLADVLIARFGYMFVGEHIYRLPYTDILRFSGSLLLILVFGGLLGHGIKKANWELVLILSGGIFCTVLSAYVNREADPEFMMVWSGRHYYLPAVTMAWSLLLWQPKRRFLYSIPILMIATTFLLFTPENKNQVFPDLDWAGEIAACNGIQPRCQIPINPVWEPLRWFATIDSHITNEPEFSVPFRVTFSDQFELRGYTTKLMNDELFIELVWFVTATPEGNYIQFVHLVAEDEGTQILVRSDTLPQQGQYLTNAWTAGEYIVEPVTLPLSSIAAGEYSLFIGWYDANSANLERMPAFSSGGQQLKENSAQLPSPVIIDP